MDTRHNNSLATQHDVLLAFNVRSSRDLVASVLDTCQRLSGQAVSNASHTVSIYSPLVERRFAGAEGRDMMMLRSKVQ